MQANQLLITALNTVSGRPEPSTGVVVATGLILVFSVLVLLYFIIIVQGKIFTAIDNKKNGGANAPKAAKPEAQVKAAPKAAAAPAPMKIQTGIPGEVIAAIAAAVAGLEGGKYTVKSVKRAARTGRSAWGQAGVVSYTEPF